MKTRLLTADRWLRLRPIVRPINSRSLLLMLVVSWTVLVGNSVNADTVDGREIPEFSDGKIVLPELAFGGSLYTVELTLVSTSGP
ncbi:MAG: hypothetical protein KKD00_12345, partial [Gammaproteobacteria bacterium]|nr:hypothetical protein [Gammaproteobacteria bacterium]